MEFREEIILVTIPWLLGFLGEPMITVFLGLPAAIYFTYLTKINIIDRHYEGSLWKAFKGLFKRFKKKQ